MPGPIRSTRSLSGLASPWPSSVTETARCGGIRYVGSGATRQFWAVTVVRIRTPGMLLTIRSPTKPVTRSSESRRIRWPWFCGLPISVSWSYRFDAGRTEPALDPLDPGLARVEPEQNGHGCVEIPGEVG